MYGAETRRDGTRRCRTEMLAKRGHQVRDACEDGRTGRQHVVCERDGLNDYLTTSAHSLPAAKTEHFESKLLDTRKLSGLKSETLEELRHHVGCQAHCDT